MSVETLYDGITQVADDLVDRAAEPCVSVRKKRRWIPAVAAAAACAVLVFAFPRMGGFDSAAPESAETPGSPAPGAAPETPSAPLPSPAPESPPAEVPYVGDTYTNFGAAIGLEERYWRAMDNCVAIWYHETDFPQEILAGVTVSVLSDAVRPSVVLADGSEIDAEAWEPFIDVTAELEPAVEYWDFAFPNGIHSIMDSRTGQMVGYILP